MTLLAFDVVPPTRVTLLDASGAPVVRWTLQAVSREGRALRWAPEGVLRQLGGGAASVRRWAHRGFRLELGLLWSHGLTSWREEMAGSTWSTPAELPTATAHSEILGWSAELDLTVEPFVGTPMPSFTARAFEQGPSLADTKGVAHPALSLALQAVALVNGIFFQQALGWGIGPFGILPWGD